MRALRLGSRAQSARVERLEEFQWRKFFQDPAMWWDNRTSKRDPQQPDFVHSSTKEELWINSPSCPDWLPLKLRTLAGNNTSGERVRAGYRSVSAFQDVYRSVTNTRNQVQQPDQNEEQASDDNSVTFQMREDLKFCTSLEEVKKIHSVLIKTKNDSRLARTLLAVYSRFGSMNEARPIFENMNDPGLGMWNAMVRGYSQAGNSRATLEFFDKMLKAGFTPDPRLFLRALKACGDLAMKEPASLIGGEVVKPESLKKAKLLHSQAEKCGHESNIFVANTVLDMYSKCGSMSFARKVFERMACHDSVSWNALITGYAQNRDFHTALELLGRMKTEEFKPDGRTYLAALNACSGLAEEESDKSKRGIWLEKGREFEAEVREVNLQRDVFVANALVDMYSKCGCMKEARRVFDEIEKPTPVSWNAIITGYAHNSDGDSALAFFTRMREKGFTPNSRSYVAALQGCSALAANKDPSAKKKVAAALEKAQEIHAEVKAKGLSSNIFIANSLVEMYSRCGSLEEARRVFDGAEKRDLALYNVMMLGYAQGGQGEKALELLAGMKSGRNLVPNHRSFAAALVACGSLGAAEEGKVKKKSLEKGMKIHSQVAKAGLEFNVVVANNLVEMYVRCGSMSEARKVFDRMEVRDEGVWRCMVVGYVEGGENEEGLEFYRRMKEQGHTPDAGSYNAALRACESFESGKAVSEIRRTGLIEDSERFNAQQLERIQASSSAGVAHTKSAFPKPEK